MSDKPWSMTEWARGRTWWVRAPVLLWVAWMAVSAIRDPDYQSLFRGLNFGVHEFGHLLWSPFGEFMTIAGGSITQLLVPFAAGALLLWQQRDWFAVSVCGCWLAGSLAELSRYIGDARALELNLVTMGEAGADSDVTGHDWQYLLMKTHLLQRDTAIAHGCRVIATLLLIASVLLALRLFYQMATLKPKDQTS
jgi:hypothetical protein